MNKEPKIIVIGGGSGASTIVSGLSSTEADVSAVISMVDNGGSTGRLREQLGVLANSDVRRSIQALSSNDELVKLFSYRFEAGDIKGHTLGNLLMAAAEKTTGSFQSGVDLMMKILDSKGKVIPACTGKADLMLEAGDRKIVGEHDIDCSKLQPLKERPYLYLSPQTQLSARAEFAIREADLVVIAPGSLYTSLGGVLTAEGADDALQNTRGTVVYICNLINIPDQTSGFYVQDYAEEIERLAGGNILDFVIYNNDYDTVELSDHNLYVLFDEQRSDTRYKCVDSPLISSKKRKHNANDSLSYVRSEVLHDTSAVSDILLSLCREEAVR